MVEVMPTGRYADAPPWPGQVGQLRPTGGTPPTPTAIPRARGVRGFRRQKAEGRREKAEGRRQKAEGRRQKSRIAAFCRKRPVNGRRAGRGSLVAFFVGRG